MAHEFQSKISDVEVLELFRKYEQQTFETFVTTCTEGETAYDVTNINQYAVWDEMFGAMCDDEFCELILDGMENSVGVEDYGIINPDDEEDE